MSNQARQILENRLSDEWADQTPIYWDDENDKPIPGTTFLRCVLDGISSDPISISCQRNYDMLVIQVFTPKGDGAGGNFILCDELERIFRGYAEGNLLCIRTLNQRVGKAQEWYQRNVIVDTQYDDHTL